MPSWSSPSGEAPAGVDRAVLFRRFVEASRRAEIVALVNSARTEREVADVIVDELAEALEAEIAFVVVARPDRGEHEVIGHVGVGGTDVAALPADALCRSEEHTSELQSRQYRVCR